MIINSLTNYIDKYRLNFKADINIHIDSKYKTPQSKEKTIAVLGSSKATDDIMNYMEMCANSTKALVLSGKNLVHGCGAEGIMGKAYNSGYNYSAKNKDGLPEQNLAILTEPLWGDEDIEHCIPIGCAKSEADRIEKFAQVANTILIFPGSAGTLQEATTLISKNYYGKPDDKKKIVLIGKKFFEGLNAQYEQLYNSGLIKCKPEELYSIVDSEKEILEVVNN